jgi:hypothetical protein
MDSLPILACKTRRILRGSFPAMVEEFYLDVWGRGRAFDAVLAIAVAYIGLSTASIPEVVATADSWILFLQAFFYVVCGWAVLCLVRAPFSVVRADREAAKWIGSHRVYHEPKLIATERITDINGDTHAILLRFPDADPSAFVRLRFDCEPPVHNRMLLAISRGLPTQDFKIFRPDPPNQVTGFFAPNASVGITLTKNKTATLYARLDPHTVPVTIRVYCSQYGIGKDSE